MILALARLDGICVQLHVLVRVFDGGLNKFEAYNLLGFLTEANANCSGAAANVEKDRLLIDSQK